MTQKEENNEYNFTNDPSGTDIDGLMETLLKNKKHETMKTVLDCLTPAYDKYEYYLDKMKDAREEEED